MSRIYKFRAWEKTDSIMITPFSFGSINAGDDYGGSHWEVMQYTGILDSGGREIYEGDIVRFTDGRISTVVWDAEMYSFQFSVSKYVADQEAGSVRNGEVTLIGNIYENPELFCKDDGDSCH